MTDWQMAFIARSMALDGTGVYTAFASGALLHVSRFGGFPQLMQNGGSFECVAVDSDNVYFTDFGNRAIAVDLTHVYWIEAVDGVVWKVAK